MDAVAGPPRPVPGVFRSLWHLVDAGAYAVNFDGVLLLVARCGVMTNPAAHTGRRPWSTVCWKKGSLVTEVRKASLMTVTDADGALANIGAGVDVHGRVTLFGSAVPVHLTLDEMTEYMRLLRAAIATATTPDLGSSGA